MSFTFYVIVGKAFFVGKAVGKAFLLGKLTTRRDATRCKLVERLFSAKAFPTIA